MNLKQYVKENNLKVSQISEKTGLPYSTVSELVNGKKSLGKCTANTVFTLAKYLNTTIEDLLIGDTCTNFPNKYALDEKQSFFLAKKKWDENVYCGMKMEERVVTFPQTRTILDGINIPRISLEDIQAIKNMRDAWVYILNNIKEKLDFNYICKLNSFIARDEAIEWGVLRTGSVGISGCTYKPAIPVKEKVEGSIRRILSSYISTTEKALELFCFITYNQLFWDGNKRTALTTSNKILLDNGCGMIIIKDEKMQEFNENLLNMYETGNKEPLKNFLYDKAIIGIDF